MANRRPLTESAAEIDGPDSANSITSVAHDFTALVAILEHQLELVAKSDQQTRSHITQAKEAAERGAKLSRELLERMESGN